MRGVQGGVAKTVLLVVDRWPVSKPERDSPQVEPNYPHHARKCPERRRVQARRKTSANRFIAAAVIGIESDAVPHIYLARLGS